ncbi:HAD-IIA family hydrolase [Kocuria subflava]|uniref:HAD-IIA family hydrolase n=1 Tax=Kocuria subflava TaxID=1736139 RepID=A0A846TU43_9MICC|nr:HAD-IIA family hydrolase [Kocuria subflava]NKE10329.1 HAD-IIA family hydrolase [Kocuria subflava]
MKENPVSADRLIDRFDAVLSDLDGVVYAGPHAIPGAPEALESVKAAGIPVVFVTNNASRSVEQVAEHLSELEVATTGEQVISSAQAAAVVLKDKLDPGAKVMITGSQALAQIVRDAGLEPVWGQEDQPQAVVQGFDPGLGWKDLAEAAFVLADSEVLWVATNTDGSIPQARGIAPGNGTLVAAVRSATKRDPLVAGKPEAPIFTAGAQRVNAQNPVVIGDRLDTDILGGNRAGFATIAVLTGVDTLESILGAVTAERPQIVINELSELFEPLTEAELVTAATGDSHDDDAASPVEARCKGAWAQAHDGGLTVHGDRDDLNAWRAAMAAWWDLNPEVTTAHVPEITWESA